MIGNILTPASWLINSVPTRFVASTFGQTIAAIGVLEPLLIVANNNGLPVPEGARLTNNAIEVTRPGVYRAHVVCDVRNTHPNKIEGGTLQVVDETGAVLGQILDEIEIKSARIATFELDATVVISRPNTQLSVLIKTNNHEGTVGAGGMFEVLRLGPVATDCAVTPSPTAVR